MKAQGMLGSGPRLPCEWAASRKALFHLHIFAPAPMPSTRPHASGQAFPDAPQTTNCRAPSCPLTLDVTLE